jgi:heme exporter protein D
MSEFLAMGGYAAFIWPAYLLAAVLLGGLTFVSLRSMREREATVASLRQRRAAGQTSDANETDSGT